MFFLCSKIIFFSIFSAEDLEKMIEEEGTKVLSKGLKKDTEGTLKLRNMVDTVDIESENTASRLILAQVISSFF